VVCTHGAAGLLKRVGIFAATRWEQAAVSRAIVVEENIRGGAGCIIGRRGACRVYVFRTGIGPVKAEAVSLNALTAHPVDLAISSGFACALTSSCIGDVLIGTDVTFCGDEARNVEQGGTIPCSVELRTLASEVAHRMGLEGRTGRIVSTGRILWLAEEKRRLASGTGAIGLDMESAAIGMAAQARHVPFLVARTVSDLLDEDLPLDFNLFLTPKTWPRGVLHVMSRPCSLQGVNRLRRQSRRAAGRLTRFLEGLLDELQ